MVRREHGRKLTGVTGGSHPFTARRTIPAAVLSRTRRQDAAPREIYLVLARSSAPSLRSLGTQPRRSPAPWAEPAPRKVCVYMPAASCSSVKSRRLADASFAPRVGPWKPMACSVSVVCSASAVHAQCMRQCMRQCICSASVVHAQCMHSACGTCATRPSDWMLVSTASMSLFSKRATVWKRS